MSSLGTPSSGLGAADYGTKVYGGPGQQMADPAQGSTIKMNSVGGGRRRRRSSKRGKSRKGGVGLTQMLVPAALIAAKYAVDGRRSRRFRRSRSSRRRFRRSGRR